jgi:lysophospholipase L1-like esterase
MRPSLRAVLQNLSLTLGALVVLGLLLEGAARLFLPVPGPLNFTPDPSSILMAPPFPGVRFVLRPGASGVHHFPSDPRGHFDPGATLTYRINALGFRGPETTLEKPPGTFRVVGLGDSFTFGTGVRARDTFLAELERRLNADSGGRRFEVLNLGVFGYDTTEEVAMLEHRGLALDPDLVVLCFFLNDVGDGRENDAFNPANAAQKPFWRRHSHLADYIATRFERKRGTRELVRFYHHAFEEGSDGWNRARWQLHLARRMTEKRGVPLVVVVFPELWKLSDHHPFADIYAKVVAFAQGEGIPALDLLPAFAGHDGPELWVHPANMHPDAEAHRIAGDALYRFLVERKLVPGGPEPPPAAAP